MLADAVLELAQRGGDVTLLARDPERLERVRAAAERGVHPVSLDYRDGERLRTVVRDAALARGPITGVIAWIHRTAPDAHDIVATEVGSTPPLCRYLEILGSASQDPTSIAVERAARLRGLPHLDHRRVILGYGGEGERWLTDQEISDGVLAALDVPGPRTSEGMHVVGTLAPYRCR